MSFYVKYVNAPSPRKIYLFYFSGMLYTQTLKTAYLFPGPTPVLLWYFVSFLIHFYFKIGFTIWQFKKSKQHLSLPL